MGSKYICDLDDKVNRKSVSYKNRYGLKIVGDLYTSKDFNENKKYPALIVGAPYGGVKEQGPCVYANQLAQRGFVVLTFDQSFMGESEGEPRNVSSPDIFTENFSAAVDFLGVQDFVNREKIGVIGICGSGGFSLSAAQMDPRIKAIVTASMYDMSVAGRGILNKDELEKAKIEISHKRWEDFEKGTPEYLPTFPEEPTDVIPEGLDPVSEEFWRFYAFKRGHHPNARGNFTTTSQLSFFNFRLLDYIDEISPRPILFIVGDRAHSKFFSEDAYAAANEPKELLEIEDAEHIDLYDRLDKIPFDKIESFFKEAL